MIGLYDNFPENIHRIANFTSSVSAKKLQENLVHVLHEMNCRAFSFDDFGHQALRECTINFEAGRAESKSFSYIDEEEKKKLQEALKKKPFRIMDFFFAVRYYKIRAGKKTPLKFDYYLLRCAFGENSLELRVFHERGPRYMSPEDIVSFIVNRINEASTRRILKEAKPAIS